MLKELLRCLDFSLLSLSSQSFDKEREKRENMRKIGHVWAIWQPFEERAREKERERERERVTTNFSHD